MLFHLLYALRTYPGLGWLNVMRYPSTRIIASTLSALSISFILGPWFIRQLQSRQIGQSIRDDGPQSHLKKAGTPTMGGSLILLALIIPTLLWSDLSNTLVWIVVAITVLFGVIGFVDDYLKIRYKNSKGLSGKMKLLGQTLVSAVALWYLLYQGGFPDEIKYRLVLPFVGFDKFSLLLPGIVSLLLGVFIIVGSSNAVNLTDGLDGLAIVPTIICAGAFLIIAYATGSTIGSLNLATYLHIAPIPQASELCIYCAALIGAGIGFLWFNTYPASVFMGDVGSLALGGGLGALAILTKHELVWAVLGGIFVLEAVSVIVQVISFKTTGKRVFKMAPIHHHFELKGWAEPKVIVRFWIISFMLALLAIGTLKLR